eukprot:CAMPEP_0180252806 /NCGR_PEP_ID=MMETSP0987-20121128/39246_1 /TAXON_ID=697907 /ORGANISM="non described non described, Strain CCMP2293" /LENGTH=84 /DNA_ID=CAMNT_0022221597 /DNA_START=229 /DNA_END=484 /DNA_ORIENTATION=+
MASSLSSLSSLSSSAGSTSLPVIVWHQGKARRVRASKSFNLPPKVAAYFQEELAREFCIASSERGAGAAKRATPESAADVGRKA